MVAARPRPGVRVAVQGVGVLDLQSCEFKLGFASASLALLPGMSYMQSLGSFVAFDDAHSLHAAVEVGEHFPQEYALLSASF